MPHDAISMLMDASRKHASSTAIRQGESSYTYRELGGSIKTLASNIKALGVQPGDRFMFSLRPTPDHFVLALGIIAAGGVIVFSDSTLSDARLQENIKIASPKYLVVESERYMESSKMFSMFASKKSATNYKRIPVEKHFYSGRRLPGTPFNAMNIQKLFKETDGKPPVIPEDPTAEAMFAFSGNTESSEIIVHSRASLGSSTNAYVTLCKLTKKSVVYANPWVFGMAALMAGGQWVIPEYPLIGNEEAWTGNLLSEKATHTFMTASEIDVMLEAIKKHHDGADYSDLESVIIGSAKAKYELFQRMESALPTTSLVAYYGVTEVYPQTILENVGKVACRNGDLAGGVILGVIPRMDNIVAKEGGELVLSGDIYMLTHGGGDKHKHEGMPNGYSKDVLVRRGKSIYPAFFEPAITELNGVSTCVMVGVPDRYGDDIVVLVVVPEGEAQDDRRLIRKVEAHLRHVMDDDALPDVIVAQSEVPMSKSGKVNRIQLRKDMAGNEDVQTVFKGRAVGWGSK